MNLFFSLFQKKLKKPKWILIYFPIAFKIPTTTITPQAPPIRKEPEEMAKAHTAPAAPDKPLIICWLGSNAGFGEGAGQTWSGTLFGTSFATAGNTGATSTTPKILRTVAKPNNKDLRFDLGLLLAS